MKKPQKQKTTNVIDQPKPKNVEIIADKKYFKPDKKLTTPKDTKTTSSTSKTLRTTEIWTHPTMTGSLPVTIEFKNKIVTFMNYVGVETFLRNINNIAVNICKG